MSSSVNAVVLGHAEFAQGMVGAVEQVSGMGGALLALSSVGLGAGGIEQLLREALETTGARVIFTDLPSGSATMAARRLQRAVPGLIVVAAANLAQILAFVQLQDRSEEGGAARAFEKGRAAMALYGDDSVG
jgi:PTS system N-acetylgalactosamine-specific IIA component